MTCVLLRRGNLGTYTHILEEGDHHVKMIGDMLLQAKELKDCQQTPETRWEAWNWFSRTARWKKPPCWHPDLGSQSPELWGLCFKPSSVWTLRWWPEQTNSVYIHNILKNKLSCQCAICTRTYIVAHQQRTSDSEPLGRLICNSRRYVRFITGLGETVWLTIPKGWISKFCQAALNSLQLCKTSNPKEKHDLVFSRFLPIQMQV